MYEFKLQCILTSCDCVCMFGIFYVCDCLYFLCTVYHAAHTKYIISICIRGLIHNPTSSINSSNSLTDNSDLYSASFPSLTKELYRSTAAESLLMISCNSTSDFLLILWLNPGDSSSSSSPASCFTGFSVSIVGTVLLPSWCPEGVLTHAKTPSNTAKSNITREARTIAENAGITQGSMLSIPPFCVVTGHSSFVVPILMPVLSA